MTYELARVVADILPPLIAKTIHHILNTQTFVEKKNQGSEITT